MTQVPDPMLSPVAGARSAALSGNILAIMSMMTWAAGFPAAEILLENWSSLSLTTARLGMTVALLVPIWILVDGPDAFLNARWGRGLLVGGLGFGIGAWLLLVGQALTDVITVAIIASACPVAAVVVEMFYQGRRLSIGFGLGLVATVAGGVIATGGGGVALGLGALATVGSCFLFAWSSFMAIRDFPALTALGRSTLTFAGGFVATAILTLASHAAGIDVLPRDVVGIDDLGLLAIYAGISMALSQVLFLGAVGRMGVALTCFHINVAPFYVMLLMLALGGIWDWNAALGALVVAIGVVLAQRPAR